MHFNKPISELVGDRILTTVILAMATVAFTWTMAIPIGICSAVRQRSLEDYTFTFLADISHIRLRASEERAIHNLDDGTDTPERCQSPYRAHWTTCWRGDLAIMRLRKPKPIHSGSLPAVPGTHLALGCPSSPLMTPRIFATLVLDGARRYAPTPAGMPPGTLPPQLPIERQFTTTTDGFVSLIGWLTASVSDTTMALVGDGEVFGSRQLDMGNSG